MKGVGGKMKELFRFMVFRPPEPVDSSDTRFVQLEDRDSSFQSKLFEVSGQNGSQEKMVKYALEYTKSDIFFPSLESVPIPLAEFNDLIQKKPPTDLSMLETAIESVFGNSPSRLIERADFVQSRRRIADSILALIILHRENEHGFSQLVKGARLLNIINRIALEDPRIALSNGFESALDEYLILPPIFPSFEQKEVEFKDDVDQKENDTIQKEIAMERFVALKNSLEELEAIPVKGLTLKKISAESVNDDTRLCMDTGNIIKNSNPVGKISQALPWIINNIGLSHLSQTSRDEITRLGLEIDSTPMPEIHAAMERESIRVAADMYHVAPPKGSVTIGSSLLSSEILNNSLFLFGDKKPSFEAVVSTGAYRELGIADLELVREEIRGYKLGEIAHIENVLQGETKDRTHRRLDQRIETVTTEKETVESTERDLQSTERFELKRETQETINQESNFDFGVTLKYGGCVDVESSTKYSTKKASELSENTAMNYSREIVDHSVSKIEERIREQRVITTLQEIEETNIHNLTGVGNNIVGIYRWVDKVQEIQVVNYGKRVMYEFIIPQPAAFTLYALNNKPTKGVTLSEPKPPTFGPLELYWDSKKSKWDWTERPTEALRPHHIQWWNYQQWVAQYQVDVEPPPPQYIKKDYSWQSPKPTDNVSDNAPFKYEGALGKISPSDGYATIKSFVYVQQLGHGATGEKGWGTRWETSVMITVGPKSHLFSGYSSLVYTYWFDIITTQGLVGVEGDIPITIATTTADMVSVMVEVLCERTDSRMDKWRQKVYNAIITAYQNQKSAYDQQVETALSQAFMEFSGRNSGLNRETEQAELKRGAIHLLTQKWFPHLEDIGSIVLNKNLYKKNLPNQIGDFPEINFSQLNLQAPLIQFLEQAFEWSHMLYTFYPYFWANKSAWPLLQQLDDKDPTFARFLRAGAARVIVPVREGYVGSLRHFFVTGKPWNGYGAPGVTDTTFLPIADEIKEKYGIDFDEGKGTLTVEKDSAVITGSSDTEFTLNDVHREIRFADKTYRVQSVDVPNKRITLNEAYKGESKKDLQYSLSQYRVVGDPWPVTLPTTLVYLQKDSQLPTFPRE